MKTIRRISIVAVLGGAFACAAGAGTSNWAAPQIREVTQAGVLGHSPATFAPQSPLTQSALASAVKVADALQHPAAPPAPKPQPVTLATNIGPGAVVAGEVTIELQVGADRDVDHVDFAVDGIGGHTEQEEPYTLELDTHALSDGVHAIAANVAFAGGGYAISTWQITVSNVAGAPLSATDTLVPLAVAKSWLPAATSEAAAPAVVHTLYRASSPARAVTVKQLDAALVSYLGLAKAAAEIQSTLRQAGLQPPASTGTEAIARLLGLRLNHPAGEDWLELLPNQPVTRAEAAYSFARVLHLDDWATGWAQGAADAFTLPELTPWQRRLLTTAVHYVGYPYIWGGTSPGAETLFGVHSVGGFDCSGFVWRVVKLTSYPDEGRLPSVLRGRTTFQMSGEVPRSKLIKAADLQPADVMFFGGHGPRSKPSEVDHAALYLGNGWFIQSSGEGVTLLPFDGWYTRSFAWGRRPLREAGLTG